MPGHPHARLAALAEMLDSSLGGLDEPHGSLIFVSGPPDPADDDTIELGIKDLEGEHPVPFLLGFTAPADWQVLGVVASGNAFRYDEPDPDKVPSSFVFLADRHGATASLLRTADGVREMPGPAVGTIPDSLRRALEVPTSPPEWTTGVLFSTLWLDRLLDAAGTPAGRRALRSWDGVARLHPVASLTVGLRALPPDELASATRDLVARWPWERVRRDVRRWSLPGDADVAPDVAMWMDDGMFCRWVVGGMPGMRTLVHDLGPLLPDELAIPMVAVIEAALAEAA